MKIRGFAEQYDGGRAIEVQRDGAHVRLSVEAFESGNGVVLLTPTQARVFGGVLLQVADDADAEAERAIGEAAAAG